MLTFTHEDFFCVHETCTKFRARMGFPVCTGGTKSPSAQMFIFFARMNLRAVQGQKAIHNADADPPLGVVVLIPAANFTAALSQAGDAVEALRRYSAALSLTPDDHLLHSNRSMALAKLGRWSESEQVRAL